MWEGKALFRKERNEALYRIMPGAISLRTSFSFDAGVRLELPTVDPSLTATSEQGIKEVFKLYLKRILASGINIKLRRVCSEDVFVAKI